MLAIPAALTPSTPEIVTGVFIMTALAALIAPLIRYLAIGWRAKRKDIMDGMSAYARFAYFRMFSRSEAIPKQTEASQNFEKLYSHWYGRRLFCVPGILFAVVGLIAVGLVILTVVTERGYLDKNPLFTLPATAVSAVAGAYLWVLNDHISRARRRDFSPSDVSWGSLRIIISIPMGYAFASIDPSVGPFVAFALGAFPLTELQNMLRRLANKRLQLNGTPEETSDDIVKLQGINKDIAERLADEDIQTVTQVAYCDPVQLTMRSNLSFDFVSDCMNQALAWMYLEKGLDAVRPLGLRGAQEIMCLISDLDNESAEPESKRAHDLAVAAIPVVAKALNQDAATAQFMLRQIAADPYTLFLQHIWDDRIAIPEVPK
jgi:hypothetical protein